MSHESSTMPDWAERLVDPAEERLSELSARLAALDGPCDESGQWPDALWTSLTAFDAPRWSMPAEVGGDPCERSVLLQRYARVAEGSLTAAFILSQHDAGVRRLLVAIDRDVARTWVARIAAGQ